MAATSPGYHPKINESTDPNQTLIPLLGSAKLRYNPVDHFCGSSHLEALRFLGNMKAHVHF